MPKPISHSFSVVWSSIHVDNKISLRPGQSLDGLGKLGIAFTLGCGQCHDKFQKLALHPVVSSIQARKSYRGGDKSPSAMILAFIRVKVPQARHISGQCAWSI